MILDPQTLRESPELATLDLLVHASETAILALSAAHPALEHELRHDPLPPLERLADHVIDQAVAMLDAIERYRRLVRCVRSDALIDNDSVF